MSSGIVTSLAQAAATAAVKPDATGGGSGGAASLVHQYLISEATSVDVDDSAPAGADLIGVGEILLSAAGGGHATEKSLDLSLGNTPGGFDEPPAEFHSTGRIAMTWAWKIKSSIGSTTQLWQRGPQTSIYAHYFSGGMQIFSQFMNGFWKWTVPIASWHTWTFYCAATDDDMTAANCRFWIDGVEQTAFSFDTAGASATEHTGGVFGADVSNAVKAYLGDLSYFDTDEASCIEDLLAEEAIIRARYV